MTDANSSNPITDPVERECAALLDALGIPYRRDGHGGRCGLDFDCGNVFIECKAMHSDRIAEQTSRVDNVIVFQGIESVRMLARAIPDRYLTMHDIRNAANKGLANGLQIAIEAMQSRHVFGLTDDQIIRAMKKTMADTLAKITDEKLRNSKA